MMIPNDPSIIPNKPESKGTVLLQVLLFVLHLDQAFQHLKTHCNEMVAILSFPARIKHTMADL